MLGLTRNTLIATVFAAFGLAGCDLFRSDAVVVRGTVSSAATGAPVGGVAVSLEAGGGFGSDPDVLDRGLTDREGHYELETTFEDCARLFSGFRVVVDDGSNAFWSARAECERGEQVVDIAVPEA